MNDTTAVTIAEARKHYSSYVRKVMTPEARRIFASLGWWTVEDGIPVLRVLPCSALYFGRMRYGGNVFASLDRQSVIREQRA
jgi:hypothetical protein